MVHSTVKPAAVVEGMIGISIAVRDICLPDSTSKLFPGEPIITVFTSAFTKIFIVAVAFSIPFTIARARTLNVVDAGTVGAAMDSIEGKDPELWAVTLIPFTNHSTARPGIGPNGIVIAVTCKLEPDSMFIRP